MQTPTTTMNEACSDPSAAPTSWEDTLEVVKSAELFWIATVRSSGQPHMTPLVAVWEGEALHFCTGESEQKALNLRENPNVILMTGCNGWQGGLDVVVEGSATLVTDGDDLKRLSEAWARKWDGRWEYTPSAAGFTGDGSESVLVFRVIPTKVYAFAKGLFGHTRHAF